MLNCPRYIVEGKFDKIILNRIGISNVDVGNGKENVIRQFRMANTGCFLIDGNDEGFTSISSKFQGASSNPPIISIGNKKLIVIGNPEKGSMESVLLKMIEIGDDERKAIDRFLRKVRLTDAQKDKVTLILSTFLKTQDYQVFFSIDRFASRVVDLIGEDRIRKRLEELQMI